MISLLVDTCTKNACIGLFKDKVLIDKIVSLNEIDLSSNFMVLVNNIVEKNNLEINDIDKFFVAIGPGSFTGIRIGVTCIKVMSWALKKDVIPFSSLELLASNELHTDYVIPLIDARRGYVFAGVYDKKLNCLMDDKYIRLSDLISGLDSNKTYTYVTLDKFEFDTELPNYKMEKVIDKHYNDIPINPHSLNPNYLKRTEAEEKKENIND